MITIKKGVVYTFLTKILVSLLGLVTVIIISKNIGAEGRGVLSLFVLSISMIQLICDYGSSSALINLSYKYSNKNLWYSSVFWVLIICGLGFVVSFFIKGLPYIQYASIIALLLSIVNINNLLLMGNQQVLKRNFNLILLPLLILVLFSFLLFKFSLFTMAYVYAFAIAAACVAFISFYFIKPYLKNSSPINFERDILKVGFWAQSGHIVQFLNYRANFILIAFYLGDANLGVYSNAIVIGETLWIFGHSLGQIQHLKILNSNNLKFHKRITLKFIFINALFTFISLVVLLAIPSSFWEWLFSIEFIEIRRLLFALSSGIIVFSFSNIFNHYFHAINKFKLIVLVNAIGFVIGILSSIILIPNYGLVGACYAWSAGLMASGITYLIFFLKS